MGIPQILLMWSKSQPPPGRIMEGIGSLGHDSMLGTSPEITYPFDIVFGHLDCYQDAQRSIQFRELNCQEVIDLYEIKTSTTNLDAHDIKIYPNPFYGQLNIDYGKNNHQKNSRL